MFRPKLLFTSLAALALGACAPQDPQAQVTAALSEQVILPTYNRWVEADRALAKSAVAYCSGQIDLQQAHADFFAAQKAWAELQPLLVGPLAEGNLAWRVQFWPDKKNLVQRQVEQLLKANPGIDAASLEKASVVVRGLTAYEYILFDPQIEQTDAATRQRYCPLLEAIGARQQHLAESILASWTAKDGMAAQLSKFPNNRYAESKEAIAELLRVQITAIDTLKKKLGAPLGRQTKGIPQPYQAEAWRSATSLANVGAALASAESLWHGGKDGKGLRDLLGSEQQDLAARIDAAYAEASGKLQALEPPLTELLASPAGVAQANDFYDSLNRLHRLQEIELAKALNVQLGFNANDGD